MMAPVEIQIAVLSDQPEVGIATVGAPLDAKIAGKIEEALRSTGNPEIRTLILDLGGVRYINSMGMTYLVQLSDQLESLGGGLRLANPQPKVKLLLEMMGLTTFLKIYSSVQGALRSVAGSKKSCSTKGEKPSVH